MLSDLNERLALPAFLIGLVGLLVGISLSAIWLVFGLVFLVYAIAYLAVLLWLAFSHGRYFKVLFVLYAATFAYVVHKGIPGYRLENFGTLQAGGMLFLSVLALAVLDEQRRRYRQNHKECPACCSTVAGKASVCKWCGYRWLPTIEPPDDPEGA